MKYVALLRGINVGGNSRVEMSKLKGAFEGYGFYGVRTYINSGNIVFSADHAPTAVDVVRVLEKAFGFVIPTLVLSAEKIQAIADAIPSDWSNDAPQPDGSGQRSDVVYLFDELNSPDVIEKLGIHSDIETAIYVDGALLHNVSRLNQGRSALVKMIGTPNYKLVTIRNVNTTRRLAELVKQ